MLTVLLLLAALSGSNPCDVCPVYLCQCYACPCETILMVEGETMMRLVDCEPEWLDEPGDRRGTGIIFWAEAGHSYLRVYFANPLDGGPPVPDSFEPKYRWQRTGETFDTLTLVPSIDATGVWHGFITNGEVTP